MNPRSAEIISIPGPHCPDAHTLHRHSPHLLYGYLATAFFTDLSSLVCDPYLPFEYHYPPWALFFPYAWPPKLLSSCPLTCMIVFLNLILIYTDTLRRNLPLSHCSFSPTSNRRVRMYETTTTLCSTDCNSSKFQREVVSY